MDPVYIQHLQQIRTICTKRNPTLLYNVLSSYRDNVQQIEYDVFVERQWINGQIYIYATHFYAV